MRNTIIIINGVKVWVHTDHGQWTCLGMCADRIDNQSEVLFAETPWASWHEDRLLNKLLIHRINKGEI